MDMFNCQHKNYALLDIFKVLKMCHNRIERGVKCFAARRSVMDELRITKKTEPVMFTIRVDKAIVDFYDRLASETNRSRNELIAMALEFAMEKIKVETLEENHT
jgi:hypothetical protein